MKRGQAVIDTSDKQMMNEAIKVTPDSPLFIIEKHYAKYLLSKKECDRALTAATICEIYKSISNRVEDTRRSGMYRLIRSHNMRKYFDGDVIEHMMGHTLGEVKQAYIKYDPEFLKKVYMENYLSLLIDEKADASTSPEFKDLKEKNEELNNQNTANRALVYQYRGRVGELEEANKELTKSSETQNILMTALMSEPSVRDLMSKIMAQTQANERKE
jgi:hypothetical protein